MEYSQGSIGRAFAARLHEGEPVYPAIEEMARREGIESAFVLVVGGAGKACVVTGPKSRVGPIEPRLQDFDDAREMVGVGTIHPSDEGPKLHLHAAFGRDETALVGCPRYGLDAYLVLEVFVLEVTGLGAVRAEDPASGLKLLILPHGKTIEPPAP